MKRFNLKRLFLGNLVVLLILFPFIDRNATAILSGFSLGVGLMGILTLVRKKDDVSKLLEESER
jgi:hypothetical protein